MPEVHSWKLVAGSEEMEVTGIQTAVETGNWCCQCLLDIVLFCFFPTRKEHLDLSNMSSGFFYYCLFIIPRSLPVIGSLVPWLPYPSHLSQKQSLLVVWMYWRVVTSTRLIQVHEQYRSQGATDKEMVVHTHLPSWLGKPPPPPGNQAKKVHKSCSPYSV